MDLKSGASPRPLDIRAIFMARRQALIQELCELDRQLGLEPCVVTKDERRLFELWKRSRLRPAQPGMEST